MLDTISFAHEEIKKHCAAFRSRTEQELGIKDIGAFTVGLTTAASSGNRELLQPELTGILGHDLNLTKWTRSTRLSRFKGSFGEEKLAEKKMLINGISTTTC